MEIKTLLHHIILCVSHPIYVSWSHLTNNKCLNLHNITLVLVMDNCVYYTCKLVFYLCPRIMGAKQLWMKVKELNEIGSYVKFLKFMLKEHKNVHICVLKLLNFIKNVIFIQVFWLSWWLAISEDVNLMTKTMKREMVTKMAIERKKNGIKVTI